jgi:CelD/BcsL family acetyltransferase involved in cellulose biosynthesis
MTSYAVSPGLAELGQRCNVGKAANCIEPLKDSRWDFFLGKHPRASLFHSSPWLESLSRTYGFQPVAYTTSPEGEALENAMVFCRVESWLTGRRMVSLPFSDHCEPLVDSTKDQAVLAAALMQEVGEQRWRYLEIRPLQPFEMVSALPRTAVSYAFHQLDLGPDIATIFGGFHKSSTQRKIRRAEREGLVYQEGSTQALLDDFYHLFTLTRKRQGLAPQSKAWFANLMECFGDSLKVRVAFRDGEPIAAMITIRYKDTMTYKYGCSDVRFNRLGSMHLLFWNAIQEAKFSGLRFLDFGRTDADQQGLITFKNRWGASQSVLTYSRYGAAEKSTHIFDLYSSEWKSRAAKYTLKHISPAILPVIGQILYRHIG